MLTPTQMATVPTTSPLNLHSLRAFRFSRRNQTCFSTLSIPKYLRALGVSTFVDVLAAMVNSAKEFLMNAA